MRRTVPLLIAFVLLLPSCTMVYDLEPVTFDAGDAGDAGATDAGSSGESDAGTPADASTSGAQGDAGASASDPS